MKKGLLGSTAIVAATAFSVGAAQAAEAPTWKMSGYLNFLAYFVSQDATSAGASTTGGPTLPVVTAVSATTPNQDDATMFFGVDEAEYHISASGATDNGLTYGLTMQMNGANEGSFSDEVYGNIGGSWGKLEFGNNDGAEDSFAVGAESIIGGVGGFDGEYEDVAYNLELDATPSILGDTGDDTKITYYSPDFSGFRLGVSYTPNLGADGPTGSTEGGFTDGIGFGAQFSGDVGGGMNLKVGGVYATASSTVSPLLVGDPTGWSFGGILGFQNFQVAASYGASDIDLAGVNVEYSYWNAGASFEQGPMYLSAGYHASTTDVAGTEGTVDVISLTADYSMAPGLGVLAEVNLSSAEGFFPGVKNDSTTLILGTKVSF